MSVKRQATTELNHENWDQEEPKNEDESGGFKIASKDVLEKRVIRTATRRSQVSGDEAKKNVFGGFTGFNKTQPSSFDLLSNLTSGKNNTTSTPKSDTSMTFGTNNTNQMNVSNSGLFSTTGTMSKLATETTKESPLFGGAVSKVTSSSSVFNTKQDSKSESPFSKQNTSASASFASKTSENSTNIFGSNSVAKTTSSPFSMTTVNTTITTATPTNSSPSLKPGPATSAAQSKDNTETERKDSDNPSSIYHGKLKGLNICVSNWIKKHVDESALCILSPIFKDYEKYLKEIQDEYYSKKEKSNKTASPTTTTVATQTKSTLTDNSLSIFSSKTSNTISNTGNTISNTGNAISNTGNTISNTNNTIADTGNTISNTSNTISDTGNTFSSTGNVFTSSDKPSGFSFGITPANNTPNTIKGIAGVFGSNSPTQGTNSTLPPNSITSNGSALFSFGTGKPFSFNSNIQQNAEKTKPENEDEDEPPKVEFTPVVEENSVYDKKCKIFFKKDENFVDKGVGTLYIKKIEETGKHQLLVRANTSLGNVLLNLVLSSALPTKRMGKNNVMMVCIPTPDFKPPPVPILIRVKTSEEADDLLNVLEKYKS